jgi:hypothetical protein
LVLKPQPVDGLLPPRRIVLPPPQLVLQFERLPPLGLERRFGRGHFVA